MYIPVNHPEINCKWCDSKFKPTTKHKKFCCTQCYKRYGKKYLGHSKGNKKSLIQKTNLKRRPYIIHKKLFCEKCNFIPEHPCQLDVDHIDGNHRNNAIENLQTLCANCHRLKTAIQLGWTK